MTDTLNSVPTLSLSDYANGEASAKQQFIEDLWVGFKHYGFVILKDHAVRPELLNKAYELSERFFAQSEAEKLKSNVGENNQRGYAPFGLEHAKSSTVADLKEFWQIGREADPQAQSAASFLPNVWPDAPSGFRETFLELFRALDDAGHVMLEALEGPLQVAPGYFDRLARQGNSILRLLHYPPVPEDAPANAVRAAAHEDINLITILVAANGAGLELLDRDGNWLPIETEPENLIVDAGDMLARITNDIIPATTHRVVNPTGPNVSRYSMPFFMHPNSDAMLECIESCVGEGAKYPPINADEFLHERLREIGLAS